MTEEDTRIKKDCKKKAKNKMRHCDEKCPHSVINSAVREMKLRIYSTTLANGGSPEDAYYACKNSNV